MFDLLQRHLIAFMGGQMARAAKPQTPQKAALTPEQMRLGIKRLEKRLALVRAFDPETLDRNDPDSTVRPLSTSVEAALTETFGHDTIEYERFRSASRFDWPLYIGGGGDHRERVDSVKDDRLRSIQLLEAAIELLQERLDEIGGTAAEKGSILPRPSTDSRRVFIVHGHDEGPREAVARFIGKLGFEPVILHEQASRGRTIIAKLRDEAAQAGFAVVLLTPDDEVVGARAGRARQNVIFELGFFLGALGPDRVAAIVKKPVETPSDYDGVVYIPYDSDWKMPLAKELQAAGYEVDWNKVMG